jgi:hypothetical protein
VKGPTIGVVLAWGQWHLCRRTPLILFENVPEFPVDLLRALLGHVYKIYTFYLSPADVGIEFLSRLRLFVWMVFEGVLSPSRALLLVICHVGKIFYVIQLSKFALVLKVSWGLGCLMYDVHDVLDLVKKDLVVRRRQISPNLPVRAALLATADELREYELHLAKARHLAKWAMFATIDCK